MCCSFSRLHAVSPCALFSLPCHRRTDVVDRPRSLASRSRGLLKNLHRYNSAQHTHAAHLRRQKYIRPTPATCDLRLLVLGPNSTPFSRPSDGYSLSILPPPSSTTTRRENGQLRRPSPATNDRCVRQPLFYLAIPPFTARPPHQRLR